MGALRSDRTAACFLAAGLMAMMLYGCSQPNPSPPRDWSWVHVPAPANQPGIAHECAATFDRAAGRIILFGGHGVSGGSERADTWTFDPVAGQWTNPEPVNRPVGACCVRENVYDEANEVSYYFGGHSHEHGWQWFGPRIRGCRLDQWGKYRTADVPWAYDSSANTWRCTKPLVSRPKKAYTGAAYHSGHQVVVCYSAEKLPDNSVWVYDGFANTWTALPREGDGPPIGRIPAMAYDAKRNRILAYAADMGSKAADEFWAYQLETNRWTRLPSTGGPKRLLAQLLVWDPLNAFAVLFATGEDRDGPLKVFIYNESDGRWRDQPTDPVINNLCKWHIQGVYDPVGHRTFIINGTNKSLRAGPGGGTWALIHPRPAETGRPQQPKGLRVVLTAAGDARLTWTPVQAAGYRVFRGTGELPWKVSYEKVAETRQANWSDSGLAEGKVYCYYVVAVDGAGRESVASLKVRTQPRAPAEPVVSVLAKDRAELAWTKNPEPDVVGYNVYRVVGEETRKLNASVLTGTALTDQFELPDPTKTFVCYVVKAVNQRGVESGPSPWATVIPTEPTGVRVQPGKDGAVVTWRANPQQGIAGYNVYRADDRNAEIRTLARKIAGPVQDTRYVDSTQTGPHTRKYYITAIDAVGQEGFASYGAWLNDTETR